MSKIFNSVKKGLSEAIAYSNGELQEVKVFKPKPVDVKKLRKRFKLSQPKFASSIGISVGTLRHWERGDRNPQGPSLVLLNLLSKEPEKIMKILEEDS